MILVRGIRLVGFPILIEPIVSDRVGRLGREPVFHDLGRETIPNAVPFGQPVEHAQPLAHRLVVLFRITFPASHLHGDMERLVDQPFHVMRGEIRGPALQTVGEERRTVLHARPPFLDRQRF